VRTPSTKKTSQPAPHGSENTAVVEDWNALAAREQERYREGEERLPDADDPDVRQRQLTRMANAAYGAGLALLMAGRSEEAGEWLARAAERYRESFADAPPASWGRPIGAIKARLLAGDWEGAGDEARFALDAGAAEADSPIGRYAAALACLVLGDDETARLHADAIRTREDFPEAVGDALAYLAAGTDRIGYVEAVEDVLESFETRDEYLEDVPVADTVLVLQALAEKRELAADLSSPLLPA
jgi:tetratricopeptide (TPR) repeat protein